MPLPTHAIIGAAAAHVFSSHPIIAGLAAFASHFLIDAIPHWDYIPKSAQSDPENPLNNDMKIGKQFFLDLLVIGFDAMLGVALSLLIFFPTDAYSFWIIVAGACLGILPDPLQFVYWKIRREPLMSLQRFHVWIHTSYKTWTIEQRWMVGITAQVVLVVASVWFAMGLTNFVKGV